MKSYDFDWVDAFSSRPFGGNGCAVVHEGASLPVEVCTAFVRETSLVECTFTGPSEVADVKVRYFLASHEIPFAGHPTLATVAALKDRGLITGSSVTLETGAGIVPVKIDGDLIEMTQVAPRFGPQLDPELVAATISLPVDAIVGVPQKISTGLPFCITVLKDHDALKAARLDVAALARLRASIGAEGDDMMEPFLATLKGATAEGDTYSRLPMEPPSPPEDPFTGSATGAMAAYLWKTGLMSKDSFIAEQGHGLGRPGQARVQRVGPADAPTGVRVSGEGFVLMRGHVELPSHLRD